MGLSCEANLIILRKALQIPRCGCFEAVDQGRYEVCTSVVKTSVTDRREDGVAKQEEGHTLGE